VLSSGRIYAELLAVQSQIGMTWPNGKGKYGVHKLRHFYASIMITAGTQPKRLQELLGHSTLAMTMDTYGHLFPPTEDETARINKAIAAVMASALIDREVPADQDSVHRAISQNPQDDKFGQKNDMARAIP